jgi:hypothetical protein
MMLEHDIWLRVQLYHVNLNNKELQSKKILKTFQSLPITHLQVNGSPEFSNGGVRGVVGDEIGDFLTSMSQNCFSSSLTSRPNQPVFVPAYPFQPASLWPVQ